ncbi:MAG: hypothetical protein ABEJ57_08340 [Halobacteriaceae archaeon]
MRRRRYLQALAGTVTIAGCLGTPETGSATPPPDTPLAELLPPTPDGMTADERVTLDTADTGAEAGLFVQYTAAAGERYYVEVLRWPAAAAATAGVDLYRGYNSEEGEWQLYVSEGVFSWAGATLGGDIDTLVSILGSVRWLSPAVVRATDQLAV